MTRQSQSDLAQQLFGQLRLRTAARRRTFARLLGRSPAVLLDPATQLGQEWLHGVAACGVMAM